MEEISETDIPIVPNLLLDIKRSTHFTQAIPAETIMQIHKFVEHVFAEVHTYGSEHPKMLAYLLQLSELYIQAYQYPAAEKLLFRLQTAFVRTYGPYNSRLAKTLMTLGIILYKQSKYSLSLSFYQRAYDQYRYLRRKHLRESVEPPLDDTQIDETNSTPLDYDFSQTTYGIAQCYLILKVFDFAIDYYNELLRFYEHTLYVNNAQHPSYLQCINEVVLVYEENKQNEMAYQLAMDSFSSCQRVLGANHSSTLQAVASLARLAISQKQYDQGIYMYDLAIKTCKENEALIKGDETLETDDALIDEDDEETPKTQQTHTQTQHATGDTNSSEGTGESSHGSSTPNTTSNTTSSSSGGDGGGESTTTDSDDSLLKTAKKVQKKNKKKAKMSLLHTLQFQLAIVYDTIHQYPLSIVLLEPILAEYLMKEGAYHEDSLLLSYTLGKVYYHHAQCKIHPSGEIDEHKADEESNEESIVVMKGIPMRHFPLPQPRPLFHFPGRLQYTLYMTNKAPLLAARHYCLQYLQGLQLLYLGGIATHTTVLSSLAAPSWSATAPDTSTNTNMHAQLTQTDDTLLDLLPIGSNLIPVLRYYEVYYWYLLTFVYIECVEKHRLQLYRHSQPMILIAFGQLVAYVIQLLSEGNNTANTKTNSLAQSIYSNPLGMEIYLSYSQYLYVFQHYILLEQFYLFATPSTTGAASISGSQSSHSSSNSNSNSSLYDYYSNKYPKALLTSSSNDGANDALATVYSHAEECRQEQRASSPLRNTVSSLQLGSTMENYEDSLAMSNKWNMSPVLLKYPHLAHRVPTSTFTKPSTAASTFSQSGTFGSPQGNSITLVASTSMQNTAPPHVMNLPGGDYLSSSFTSPAKPFPSSPFYPELGRTASQSRPPSSILSSPPRTAMSSTNLFGRSTMSSRAGSAKPKVKLYTREEYEEMLPQKFIFLEILIHLAYINQHYKKVSRAILYYEHAFLLLFSLSNDLEKYDKLTKEKPKSRPVTASSTKENVSMILKEEEIEPNSNDDGDGFQLFGMNDGNRKEDQLPYAYYNIELKELQQMQQDIVKQLQYNEYMHQM